LAKDLGGIEHWQAHRQGHEALPKDIDRMLCESDAALAALQLFSEADDLLL